MDYTVSNTRKESLGNYLNFIFGIFDHWMKGNGKYYFILTHGIAPTKGSDCS